MRSSETPCPGIVEEEIDDNKSHAGLSSEVVEDYSNVIQRRETGQISEGMQDLIFQMAVCGFGKLNMHIIRIS